MIRLARSIFYEQKLGTLKSMKDTWKQLREVGIGKQQKSLTDDIDCNDLNKKFTTLPCSSSNVSFSEPLNVEQSPSANSFSFDRLSEEDVVEAILSIKSNAIGLDLINPKFIKLLLPYILRFVTHIFNSILTTSEFPTEWKKAKVIPIPKKCTGSAIDFRPIAILSFLSKAFEKAISKQIQNHLTSNNLLSICQSGFRPQRSCKSALLLVADEIRAALDKDHFVLLTLLDFSKAFDTVNHSILCRRLHQSFGFSTESCKLIHSYLNSRQQCVVANGRSSNFAYVLHGVPQGSILGPLFFSMYINDLPHTVKNCFIHMYADDVQLVISRPLTAKDEAVSLMNTDLQNITRWSILNNLHLNPSKSKTLPIYRKIFDKSLLSPLQIENQTISYVDSARNLGMVFNRTLTWNDHLNSSIGKVYGSLRALRIAQGFIPQNTKLLLAKTLLLPMLLYCCEVFGDLDYATSRKLNVVYNNIARFVYNLRPYDHVSLFSNQLCGCSLNNLLKFRSLKYLQLLIQTKQPDYLHNRLNFPHSNRSLILITPRFKYLNTQRQFFIHVINLWNSLPITIRGIGSTRKFSSLLFKYLANR